MTFHFELYRDEPQRSDAPLISAELVYVNADPKTMKAAPLPEELRDRVRRYERIAPQQA
jgi:acyl-CoA thioesterase FadM